jgi:hypothetical protein
MKYSIIPTFTVEEIQKAAKRSPWYDCRFFGAF